MPKVISLAIRKGGTGKTTTTLGLAANLHKRGYKVLVIDMDPQGNATLGLGIQPTQLEFTVYEAMVNVRRKWDVFQAIIQTKEGIDLMPSNARLAGAELALSSTGKEAYLRDVVRIVTPHYDFVLIDTPPNLGILTLNALVAADSVIIPLQSHFYAFESIRELEDTIEEARYSNPDLAVSGVVMTFMEKTKLSSEVKDAAKQKFGEKVFNTVIPKNVVLAEAPAVGETIITYAPDSAGAKAYSALTEEFISRYA